MGGRLYAKLRHRRGTRTQRSFDGGAQTRLDEQFGYDNYYSHRVDARLSEDGNGELYVLLKSTGDIFRLEASAVPEPATFALLAPLGLLLRRRGPG